MNTLVRRVAETDHALLLRWQLSSESPAVRRRLWCGITHAGGATTTLLLSLVPLLTDGSLRVAGARSITLLAVSHLIVQVIKRLVSRPRPIRELNLIGAPDRFSFPSGHAAAAASVGLAYASVFPLLTVPALGIAAVVGMSRVVLGVHFPADVLAGQAVTAFTAILLSFWP